MIVKVKQREPGSFTTLSLQCLRDPNLSARAKGLWAMVISRPDNWHVQIKQLVRECKEGREAVRTAIRELEAAGYIQRCLVRHPKGVLTAVTLWGETPAVLDQYTGDLDRTDGLPILGESVLQESDDRKTVARLTEARKTGLPKTRPLNKIEELNLTFPK